MKKLIFISLLLVGVVFAQRPSSVDNSAFFPPAAVQIHANCSNFSLVYYLKSSIWNQKYNRDPSLPENQFSADFIWNQVITSFEESKGGHYATNSAAFEIMSKQGCATVADFPLQTDVENMPNMAVRETGLKYRSKNMSVLQLYGQDSAYVMSFLNSLKDSLIAGACFTVHIPFFGALLEVTKENPFYRYDQSMSQATMNGSHFVTFVGYNDDKKAFKAINSNGESFGDNGYFYMDYNWFFLAKWWSWGFTFLEENFSHRPELSLDLQVNNMVTGEDIIGRKNIFVDKVYDYWGMRFDYADFNYYFNYNRLAIIKKINNQIIPSNVSGNNNDASHSNNVVFIPGHNHDGNRQLLADLTQYVKASDFKSLEILIQDPISATYTGDNGNVLYSYAREAKATVAESYVKFVGTNKRIVGKVTSLPDTTIIALDFDSSPAGFHQSPQVDPVHVAKCVSVIRRQLVTFHIEDISTVNTLPVFIKAPVDTLKTVVDVPISFSFEAVDPDGDPVRYFLSSPEVGASIDSATGEFRYEAKSPTRKQLEVLATDGKGNTIKSFTIFVDNAVGVEDELGIPKEYSLSQNYPNPFNPATVINFSLPRSGHVTLKVYNLLGQEVAILVNGELNAGAHNTKFDASNLASGIYIYRLDAKGFSQAKKMIFTK